jgi:hypothetical protein
MIALGGITLMEINLGELPLFLLRWPHEVRQLSSNFLYVYFTVSLERFVMQRRHFFLNSCFGAFRQPCWLRAPTVMPVSSSAQCQTHSGDDTIEAIKHWYWSL